MAGDEFYLEVRNNKMEILDNIYLGKLRYNNMFALDNWRYECTNNSIYKPYYDMEERKQDNQIRYSIWNNEIIEKIRNVYNNNQPITDLEKEARNDIENALNWIDSSLVKHKNNIHFVFVVILD
jgi:hypothetical protein